MTDFAASPISIRTKLRTMRALGVGNVLRALRYRRAVARGVHPACRIEGPAPAGPFFEASVTDGSPVRDRRAHLDLFGHVAMDISDEPPDWMHNVLTGDRWADPLEPWWRVSEFEAGDIKGIWEPSRMAWVVAMAAEGGVGAASRINMWIESWLKANPPYRGPNWRCGQEAAIRVLHLAAASIAIDQHRHPQPAMLDLVELHLRRIEPTLAYAVAQDNNHGTSEAAALFVGGAWLDGCGRSAGHRWMASGRRLLEERVTRLFLADGTFSQYSTNYHRLAVDTCVVAERWRRIWDLPRFTTLFEDRLRAATDWLEVMLCRDTGKAPRLGADDGALLWPDPSVADATHADFRPTVARARHLFGSSGVAEDAEANMRGAAATSRNAVRSPRSRVSSEGGFAVLRAARVMAVLRAPMFRFRPSHADALHVDLWIDDQEICGDAGSFSYNTEPRWLEYFPGTRSHNTVEFDDQDQMPRLGRFLFGDWLNGPVLRHGRSEEGEEFADASYRNRAGHCHHRRLELGPGRIRVTDWVSGFRTKAVLRWRLHRQPRRIGGDAVSATAVFDADEIRFSIESDLPLARVEVAQGWSSPLYGIKVETPVVEVELHRPGRITTTIEVDP